MRKTFWITFGLFVFSLLIFVVKWDVVRESSEGFQFIFLLSFILLALMANFPFVSGILILLFIFVMVLVVRKMESDILKTIGLIFFMFFTAINLIGAVSLLGDKSTKETIIEHFGSEENMLAVIHQRIITENPTIKFQLVNQEMEEDEDKLFIDGDIELPLLNYVFDVVVTDDDGTAYYGGLEATVLCTDGEEDDCSILTYDFKNLKTDDGFAFKVIEETEEEANERFLAEDYELNLWEVNPSY